MPEMLPSPNQNNTIDINQNPPPAFPKKTNLLTLIFIIIVFLSLGIFFLNRNERKPATISKPNEETIKIGGILPLTTDSASFGVPMQQAAIVARGEINQNGGIAGRQIEIIWKDGKCEKNDALIAANKLIYEDGVNFLIAGGCSSEFLVSAPIAQTKKIISFSSSATSPKISQLGKYIFRTAPSDALAGKAAAQYAYNKWGAKTAAIITENKDYTLALRDVFKENFESLGGKIVADEIFDTGTTDFFSYTVKTKSLLPDVVYILPQSPTPGVLLVKALKDQGITAKLLTAEVLLIRDAVSEQGDILEGVTGIEAFFDETRPKAKHFLDLYKNEYNLQPIYPAFMTGMYDIFYLIKEAYEKNGADPDQISEYLYSLKDWEGAVGTLNFDKQGDPAMSYSIRLISGYSANQIDTFIPTQ